MRAQSKMSLGTHSQKWLSVALLCCFGVGLAVAQEVAPRSKVFPVSDEAMTCNLIDGAPNLEELCYPLADAAKVTPEDSDKWAAVVEVPAYVDLLDATDQFDPAMHAPVVSDVTRDGKPYKRYQFKGLFRSAVQVKIGWEVLYSTWVPRPTPADRAAPGVFAWHFVTPWGVEAERVAPIQLLPMPLETQQPKRIHVRLWAPSNVRISPAKLEPVLAFLQRVGVTDLVAGALTAESLIAAREKGMRIVGDQAGITGFPAAENARTDNPDYRNQDHLGRPIATGGWPYDTDLQWILDEKGKPWAGDIENYRNFALGKEVVSQDIEWNANWDNGFSPAGIRAFAARFGLDAAALTPAKIWAEHRTQWGDFRAEQTLAVHKLFHDVAKAANPTVRLGALPQQVMTNDNSVMSDMIEVGKDEAGRMTYYLNPYPTRRFQEIMDVMYPMWYEHGVQQVKDAFIWSRAIAPRVAVPLEPLFWGQARDYYLGSGGGDPGEALRAFVWGALLGGARGYGMFMCEFGARQFSWIARTNREISRLEDIILDGQKDPAGVTIAFIPEHHILMTVGKEERRISVPDFEASVLHRCIANGNTRLVGIINVNTDKEVFARVACMGLPQGEYRVTDVSEQTNFWEDAKSCTVSSARLAKGVVIRTPPQYGVTLLMVEPAKDAPRAANSVSLESCEKALAQYCKPDVRAEKLAERGGLSITRTMVGNEVGISMKSPWQEVQVRPNKGGRIVGWHLIRENADPIKNAFDFYGGAGKDLFWVPTGAMWSGDEIMPYEVVSGSAHGGVAYLTLRQKKTTAALSNLIVTKTISIRETQPGIEVEVTVENPGPAPAVNFAFWAHHMFFTADIPAAREMVQEVYMQTAAGPAKAPAADVYWAKPNEPMSPGNEDIERTGRTGATTGNWIAQYNAAGDDAVVCKVEAPEVSQFHSWCGPDQKTVSIEWMYRAQPLKAGQTWSTKYRMDYVVAVKAQDLKPLVEAAAR